MRNRIAFLFFLPSHQYNPFKPTSITTFRCLFSSLSLPAKTSNTNSNSAFIDCLTNTYKFTKTQAVSISNSFSSVKTKSPHKPQLVHRYFREVGFSETQIRTLVLALPAILFSHVDKTLKPKVDFFEEQLGVGTSDLGRFISKNPMLLARSLNKKLVPCIKILKEIYGYDENNKDFIRVLGKCKFDFVTEPQRLSANCAFLESCGIVRPQLSLILKTCPDIFLIKESKLRDLISRVLDMGFPLDSRMLHHALHVVRGFSSETLKRKFDLLGSFGFSESECLLMFRGAPVVFGASKEKLKFGIDFFLNTAKFEKSALIQIPSLLTLSKEKRVIPRYKVLQALKSKKLFEKEPSFCTMLFCREDKFLEKFLFRFKDEAEELLVAYKGHILDSSEEEEEES